jgi:hypothetical protein
VKNLNKIINPSKNTNPFNHNTSYIKLYTSLKDGTSNKTSNKDEFGQLIKTRYLDDILSFETSLLRLTRRVRVDLGRKENLHMREVQVFNYNNVNKALFRDATQSTNYGGIKFISSNAASNAVDGDMKTYSQTEDWTGEILISAC